jgi:hypothetical protein
MSGRLLSTGSARGLLTRLSPDDRRFHVLENVRARAADTRFKRLRADRRGGR